MSTNQFSAGLPEAPWWAQHQHLIEQQQPSIKSSSRKQNSFISNSTPNTTTFWGPNSQQNHPIHSNPNMFCTQNTAFTFNLNQEDDEELDEQLTDEREIKDEQETEQYQLEQEIPKEPLFEKPLTPSDVGKLNRLVIPKQHAEKYFPLNGGDSGGEKGLLLSFEDELGKSWRFRYSYWNSSQSYVLTKGWSRFVKEKRLDAGDIVLFERHRFDSDRFFIGWRRRGAPAANQDCGVAPPGAVAAGGGGGGGWAPVFYSGHPYPSQSHHGPQPPYQPDCLHAGSIVQNQTAPVGNSKTLRLFGVNLECQMTDESEPSTPEGSTLSSQAVANYHQYQQHQYYSKSHQPSYDHHNHMVRPKFYETLDQE